MNGDISRRDLPAVVKRASELAINEGDADEAISEEEVVRIAAELGLAERHVRQALFEGAKEEEPASLLDRQLGIPRIMATRAVPLPPNEARTMLEDYFVTREYLQIVRRQNTSTTFEPADDTVSKVARKFSRSKKHCLASAQGIEISVRELEPGWTHVRLKAIYPDERKSHVFGATLGTVFLGGPMGALTTVIVGGFSTGLVGEAAGVAVGVTAGIAAFSASAVGFWAAARRNYKKWRQRTVDEADSVLDRLEKGDELRPPPSPWIRKMQLKFGRL